MTPRFIIRDQEVIPFQESGTSRNDTGNTAPGAFHPADAA